MRPHFFIIFITLVCVNRANSQSTGLLKFKIGGHINADTGKVKLVFASTKDFYPKSMHEMIAEVKNKIFFFEGSIPYPQGVQILYGNSYLSDSFVITKGLQIITCNIDSGRKVPLVQNDVMREYYNDYTKAYNKFKLKSDKLNDSLKNYYQQPDNIKLHLQQELKESYAAHDEILLAYVTTHPDSYIAFWKLVELFQFGYENIFNQIFSKFSPFLKNTYTGKVLDDKIKNASSLIAVGKQFPSIKCVNKNNIPLNASSYLKGKYTLVDFWYSNCGPCNAQFDDMKNIYNTYNNSGFQIIGISTDKLKAKDNWQKVINTRELIWPQYWDKDGSESERISIVAFPTNFLLDNSGKIIKKNISMPELRQFLKERVTLE